MMVHNETARNVTILENRLTIFDDLTAVYQWLNSVILKALPLMVDLLYNTVVDVATSFCFITE